MVLLGASLSRKAFRANTPGMGIDGMRVGGGRCPFLIVGGLLLVCIMLLCNWWALTSENAELLRQIDELSEQLKYSVDERDKCVTKLGDVQGEFERSKSEVNFLRVQLDDQYNLQKRLKESEDSVTRCKIELDSLKKLEASQKEEIESMKLDKDALNINVRTMKETNEKLIQDLQQIKNENENLKMKSVPKVQKKPMNVAELAGKSVIQKSRLEPIVKLAVNALSAGERGLKFHGVPILPHDPPGAKRLPPRFSVTLLKGNNTEINAGIS